MKKIVVVVAVLAVLFSSCRLFKDPAQSESQYTTDNTTETKVFTVPEQETTKPEPKAEPKVEQAEPAPIKDDKPIAVRKEQVSFTDQNDQSANAGNTFFVILGSFSQLDNAKNARTQMMGEGFTPIILHSETGYYRVCVNSYKNESEARSRVSQIRQTFAKYADVWLLIKE